MENLLLRRGDAFSCPSMRQTAAITAELLLQGRTSFGKGEGLVIHALPHSAGAFQERDFPDDGQFSVISTGSFNVWFDEITLFKGLETAMAGSDRIRFIATGGAIPFCPAKYSGFCDMVRQSPFADRYSMPGWVSADELHAVYSSASAAVYTDIPSPETFLGARTRVLDWICRGIPVVCTRGAEISETIEKNHLGIVLPSGDGAAIAQALLRLSQNRRLCEDIVLAQKQWCENEGSAEEMYAPLMEWCRKPVRVYEKPLGRHTVPPLNSPEYFAMLYRELSEKAGIGYAAKRALKRLLPFTVLS
jgi:glycosyltransferase involved in cell wall biosynthesis